MKKASDNVTKYIGNDADELFAELKEGTITKDYPYTREDFLPFPFEPDLIKILKNGNPLSQTYYYIDNGSDYAFFIVYDNRMNLFTFGKASLFMNIQTVAFPCSLSCGGYLTNNIEFMLSYIKTIKGCKLVLNVDSLAKADGMSFGETLPTCVLKLDAKVKNKEDYLSSLRSQYRRRMNLAIKRCADIELKQICDASIDIYPLYLQTYERSDYKLERLSKSFFDEIDAQKIVFFEQCKPVGFVMLKQTAKRLVFMFCGMDYEMNDRKISCVDLYYYMLFNIVDYAIRNDCDSIDFGQTSENTKLKFGAVLEKRYFYAHHTKPVLNIFAMLGRHVLEYRYDFPDYNVFKESQ